MLTTEMTNGVVIGLLLGFQDGAPLVVFPSNPKDHAITARSLTQLSQDDVGSEVALLFEDGRHDSPMIVGRVLESPQKPARNRLAPDATIAQDEDEPIVIQSRKRMEFRCGKASIVMKADGTVTVRGTQILTRAERTNRVQGATVSLN